MKDVEALVRPSSKDKPDVKALAESGVKIRIADIDGPVEELVSVMSGSDTFICAIQHPS